MLRRFTLATLLSIGVVLTLVAAPASAQYQPEATQVLGESVVSPGGSTTVSGTGCPPNSTVTTSFDDTQVGTTTADGDGNFSLTITIPSDASPGTHTITSRCGDVVLTSTITVRGGSNAAVADGDLPRTGFPVRGLTQIGIALVAVGGGVFALRRTRLRTA